MNIPDQIPETLPDVHEQSDVGRQPFIRRLGHMCSAAIVAYEANPFINDASRIATAGAVLATTHDPLLASSVFGGMTIAVETAGAIGSADLIDTERGRRMSNKVSGMLEKKQMKRFTKNILADTAIAMTLGTSWMTFAKQSADPDRSRSENIAFGTKMATGAGIVAGAEAYAVAEGVVSPNPVTVIGGVIGLAAVLKGADVVRNTLRKAEQKGKQCYRRLVSGVQNGPQYEGLDDSAFEKALDDPRTKTLRNKRLGLVPLFTPVENNPEYNGDYFTSHYPGRPAYYHASHLNELIGHDPDLQQQFHEHLRTLESENAVLVTDHETYAGSETDTTAMLLRQAGIGFERTDFTDPRNESPAAVAHFAVHSKPAQPLKAEAARTSQDAYARLQAQNPELYNRENGTALIPAEEIDDTLMKDVWDMYQSQFEQLIAENPSMQAQTKADLEATLTSDGAMLIASFEAGKPVCAGYYVSDMDKVYWLRKEFYDARFENEQVWYFPGIVAKPEYDGRAKSLSIVALGARIAHERGMEPVVAFQCTNVSKDYIPRIVKLAIERTGLFKTDIEPIAEYRYTGYMLGEAGASE